MSSGDRTSSSAAQPLPGMYKVPGSTLRTGKKHQGLIKTQMLEAADGTQGQILSLNLALGAHHFRQQGLWRFQAQRQERVLISRGTKSRSSQLWFIGYLGTLLAPDDLQPGLVLMRRITLKAYTKRDYSQYLLKLLIFCMLIVCMTTCLCCRLSFFFLKGFKLPAPNNP